MQDDSKEHTINMGESDRYTQQMQLIDQQVLGVAVGCWSGDIGFGGGGVGLEMVVEYSCGRWCL